ncbi:tRNA uridine-5-carboxymethylaminomethyl(34) synthesis GTPase MnmE [Mesotoga sp. BH458_6_3_2_1]|uniref:tRNA uridine-5-carboxymethylaminomethyl(34) synthesis GTPase MnmE n=1 Tax=Mesotoga sp. BH458_6_3_2_1 TaxID=1437446 RepID=UPI000EF26D83|nr:tRNA uridine-5-carboxymethylaminomethyl(34) synthesis GTPase MnmE [Mesotoga sp. BH458_6_3_2_1]RLL85614.1 tRNA modification GTPase TrmE [Mesotoga sp. BH458_6_3_2_1]
MFNDRICALSTPRGISATAVIRCSGKGTVESLQNLLPGTALLQHRRAQLATFAQDDRYIDEVVVTFFKGPASYTGEDLVELSFHGNPLIVENALKALFAVGFRMALPGEFTKRAVLNGKFDLIRAEAINALITSKTEKALEAAIKSFRGDLSEEVISFRAKIIELLATVEVELNYPEEIETDYSSLLENLLDLRKRIAEFIASSQNGIVISQGIKTAIVGETNVGKSTLLNALLKRDRAIVSDLPGTTRDTIEEDLNIEGVLFRVVDTAGIREAEDEIEELGIERTLEAIEESELVILLHDPHNYTDKDLEEALKKKGKRLIVAANKSDIRTVEKGSYDIILSARTGEGLKDLERLMLKLTEDITSIGNEVIISARQKQKLSDAMDFIGRSIEAIENGMTVDVTGTMIEQAARSLDDLLGTNVTEDLLERIFSDFCVGK